MDKRISSWGNVTPTLSKTDYKIPLANWCTFIDYKLAELEQFGNWQTAHDNYLAGILPKGVGKMNTDVFITSLMEGDICHIYDYLNKSYASVNATIEAVIDGGEFTEYKNMQCMLACVDVIKNLILTYDVQETN